MYNLQVLTKIISFIKSNFFQILLVGICVFISFKNYTPGTFLTGWDTLHPEFNYKEYWKRMLGGVWQEHQGLGAVATQAHAGEIPRVLILMLFDLFVASSMVRYLYAFLMLIMGVLGVFYLLRDFVLVKLTKTGVQVGAFVGALIYLFNLATVQQFYVPLEMFLTHYGFLPWLIYFATRVFVRNTKKDKLLFILITFFSTPQAHTSTLFFTYVMVLALYLVILVIFGLRESDLKVNINKALFIFVSTLTINAYWFLPNMYFAANHGRNIQLSKIHSLFSEEARIQNLQFGNIDDISLARGFLFNWGEHVGGGDYGELLDEWIFHLNKPWVTDIGRVIFVVSLMGALLAVINRNRYAVSGVFFLLLSCFFLINTNSPTGFIYSLFQDNVPLFKEAFRFPYTKFSILLVFSYAILGGYFLGIFLDAFYKLRFKHLGLILPLVISASLIYYGLPMFKGGLLSPSMRVEIPDRYFDMFDYLNLQEEYGRVVHLPIHTFWGWVYNDWEPFGKYGYQGAGFLWFGIKQPLLDREFDRWNITNENFYREMSKAIYSEDIIMVENILAKYKARWVFIDLSEFIPSADQEQLFYDQILDMFGSSNKLVLEKEFGSELVLYKFLADNEYKRIEEVENHVMVGDTTFKEYTDPIYKSYGVYINDGITEDKYPFVGVTNYDEILREGIVSFDGDNYTFITNANFDEFKNNSHYLKVRLADDGASLLFYQDNKEVSKVILPEIEGAYVLELNNLETIFSERRNTEGIQLPSGKGLKVNIYQKVSNLDLDLNELLTTIEPCSTTGAYSAYSVGRTATGFKLSARNVNTCVTIPLEALMEGFEGDINNALFNLTYSYKGDVAVPEVCILDTDSGLCVNTVYESDATHFKIGDKEVSNYLVRFIISGVLQENQIEVDFDNVVLDIFSLSSTLDVLPSGLETAESFSDFTYRKNVLENGTGIYRNAPRYCNSGSRDFRESKININEIGNLVYESYGDSVCDSFSYPSFSHSTGALLHIRAKNIEGMPLRLCLTNEYSKRCDVYTSLPQNQDMKDFYILVPPYGENRGYTINVSNLSFGDSVSINELEYINLTPVPYEYIRSVHIEPNSSESDTKLVVLNEAYEKGWALFCGVKPCDGEHVLVNDWSNGWVIDKEVDGYKPIYIPETLEYIGFMLGIVTLIGTLMLRSHSA